MAALCRIAMYKSDIKSLPYCSKMLHHTMAESISTWQGSHFHRSGPISHVTASMMVLYGPMKLITAI